MLTINITYIDNFQEMRFSSFSISAFVWPDVREMRILAQLSGSGGNFIAGTYIVFSDYVL